MEIGIVLSLVLVAAAVAAVIYAFVRPRVAADDAKTNAWLLYESIANEVGGLAVTRSEDGWPSLHGMVDGVEVEIDHDNHPAQGFEAMLGMRCKIPEASRAPNGALWIGGVPALHTQYGRPRAVGDADGLYEIHTRAEPSASDWWAEPELHAVLTELPGAGVILYEGQLTVIFSDFDAESVRTAMRVPSVIRQGVRRVTLH